MDKGPLIIKTFEMLFLATWAFVRGMKKSLEHKIKRKEAIFME